jgi:Tfp pilus assembly protein PilO
MIVGSGIIFAASYIYNDAQAKATQTAQLNVVVQQILEMRQEVKTLQANTPTKTDLKELEERLRALERAK